MGASFGSTGPSVGSRRPGVRLEVVAPRWFIPPRNASRDLRTIRRSRAGVNHAIRGRGSVLGLELPFVVADESTDVVGEIEEPQPLLLVEGHWKAPQSVDRHAALLAHLDGH